MLIVIARPVRDTTSRASLVYHQLHGLVPPSSGREPSPLPDKKAKAMAAELAEVMPGYDVWAIQPEEF